MAATLTDLRLTVDGFLQQLEDVLALMESKAGDARGAAVQGIEEFASFLDGLDIPGLMEQLGQEVEEILEALAPIDFDPVVDPVIEGLEENAEKLDGVDTGKLNELLRTALAVAVDALVAIGFASEITTPLRDGLDEVKAVPAATIEQLRARHEQALAALEELGPERLLRLLTEALDTIRRAVGELDAAGLLEPFDRLHQRYLQEPLKVLQPSALLAPLSTSFQEQLGVFDAVRGEDLVAPLTAKVEELRSAATGVEIDGALDEVAVAVETLEQNLRELRPSELLTPLIADFRRLEDELDRFKPSRVFAPVADLAAPLLDFLKDVPQDLVTALYELFEEPLRDLESLEPQALTGDIRKAADDILALLRALDLPDRYNRLKACYFDLRTGAEAGGVEARVELLAFLDPERQLGEIVDAFGELTAALEGLKSNVEMPKLVALYGELRERLLAMLPPYARKLLDAEAFKGVMGQANPLRFLEELDERFETVNAKLLLIRPEDIAAELDAAHQAVLEQVAGAGSALRVRLAEIEETTVGALRAVVGALRVDFVAADIDNAVAELRALVEALDPARLAAGLDPLHLELDAAVAATLPSALLVAELDGSLSGVRGILSKLERNAVLGPALAAWVPVKEALAEIDFTAVLSPVVDKLDELEAELIAALARTETAYDHMLASAGAAVGGGGARADVALKASIGDDERTLFHLGVGPLPVSVEVRAADGVAPAPEFLLSGTRMKLQAVPVPATAGEFRWLSADLTRLKVRAGGETATAGIEGVGSQPGLGELCVLFTPSGETPQAVIAVYSARFLQTSVRWTKNLESLPSPEVRTGELVEMLVAIGRPPFRLDRQTRLAFYVMDQDNEVGKRNREILAYPGKGTPRLSGFLKTSTRVVEPRQLATPEQIDSAVEAFKKRHEADYYEKILILESQAPEPDYLIVAWWLTRTLGAAGSAVDFVCEVEGQWSVRSPGTAGLSVDTTPVPAPEIQPRIRLKLQGSVLDANPFRPEEPEVLHRVEVRGGGQTVQTDKTGRYSLQGWFLVGPQEIELRRSGVEPLTLRVEVRGDEAVNIVVRPMPSGAECAQVSAPRPASEMTPVAVDVPNIELIVHKIRGTVLWPDSRVVDNPDYHGTPLAKKRVYALPLEAGDIDPQRPSNSRTWDSLKHRPGVHGSGRPGCFAAGERTSYDGSFEIKYVDLSAGSRYLLWVEGLDQQGHESPDYSVRTFYRNLRELTGCHANNTREVGRHLIDHTFNLSADAVTWGVESLEALSIWHTEVVVWPDRGEVVVWPDRGDKGHDEVLGDFDPATRLLDDVRLQCLPLVPIFEPFDEQSDAARMAHAGLLEAMHRSFPRGSFVDEVRFVLCAEGIEAAIDLAADPGHPNNPAGIAWEGAWQTEDQPTPEAWRQPRFCELLEKTFLVSPQFPSPHLSDVTDARWRCDAVTLADFARIAIPVPEARARFVNRTLESDWVPVLKSVSPRLLGLSPGRHLFLAPGHGFFDNAPPSDQLRDWRSTRGGYNYRVGEDENAGYLAANVDRIARRQGMEVSVVREIRDFTRPGVLRLANGACNPSANADFLRLWQQNPVYFLGAAGETAIIDAALDESKEDHNDAGVGARWRLAAQLAEEAEDETPNPIDLFLAIHTNRFGDPRVRGVSSFWLDVAETTENAAEANSIGCDFATRLRDEIVDRCHLHRRRVLSLRRLNQLLELRDRRGNADLQRTFDHFTRNTGGSSALWPRVRNYPGRGWEHRDFPRTIPTALVEVGCHSSSEDAALLRQGWFRQLAGEALAFAVEAQLRANPEPITRTDLIYLLQAAFGPTTRILGLRAADAPIDDGFVDDVRTATGVAIAAGSTLDQAVQAVEAARFNRVAFTVALGTALVGDSGSGEAFAEARHELVARAKSEGRGDAPITRGEAASFIAMAFGWTLATLSTVIHRQVNGVTLMEQLEGADHPDKFLTRIDSQDLTNRARGFARNLRD